MNPGKSNTSERELRISRLLNAPVDQVWKAWTDPSHIINWWGPEGFSNTIHKMDLQPGGEWVLTMHGPDGKNYPNKSIFREIIPLKKIVFDHFNPDFTTTIEFEGKTEKTMLTWHMLFPTKELFDAVVKTFRADEGLKQNVTKLETYLTSQSNKMKTIYSKDVAGKKILVTRNFDAPLELVWKAWTETAMLDEWWAPKPWKTETKSMQFEKGGTWLYAMAGPANEKHWCRADYQEIIPFETFTGLDCFCDESGNINHQLPANKWVVRFEKAGNATTVKVEISFTTTEEMEKIIQMGFEQGFAMAHDNLDELLKKIEHVKL
jgi:uncharacterized protein YndB with AHSA1/START domain